MPIGVLALQGDFREHLMVLRSLGQDVREVRSRSDFQNLDGLILPGGESTTIGQIAKEHGLLEPIREMVNSGKPVWGTCAGMILLAKAISNESPHLALMDIKVQRNAFGRQLDSFEAELDSLLGKFYAVFIRAPLIQEAGLGVEILARMEDGAIVAARQKNLLVTSFHPELAADTRWHRFFLEKLSVN